MPARAITNLAEHNDLRIALAFPCVRTWDGRSETERSHHRTDVHHDTAHHRARCTRRRSCAHRQLAPPASLDVHRSRGGRARGARRARRPPTVVTDRDQSGVRLGGVRCLLSVAERPSGTVFARVPVCRRRRRRCRGGGVAVETVGERCRDRAGALPFAPADGLCHGVQAALVRRPPCRPRVHLSADRRLRHSGVAVRGRRCCLSPVAPTGAAAPGRRRCPACIAARPSGRVGRSARVVEATAGTPRIDTARRSPADIRIGLRVTQVQRTRQRLRASAGRRQAPNVAGVAGYRATPPARSAARSTYGRSIPRWARPRAACIPAPGRACTRALAPRSRSAARF